jgi:hypothetical protein
MLPLFTKCGFTHLGRNEFPTACVLSTTTNGEKIVVGRNYFTRQAATLLKFAKSTSDPKLAAALVEKASDLKSQSDEARPPDLSPQAPDIERFA